MIQEVVKHKLFVALTTFILFLVFTLNIAGALTADGFIQNDKYSENFVIRQMKCKGQLYNDQLIGLRNWEENGKNLGCDESHYLPYNSSFGLQGRLGVFLDSIVSKVSKNVTVTVVIYQLLTALFSAIILALFVLWVRIQFGVTVAITFAVFVSLSPMIVSFSRNLYWAMPLMVAPIVYILYFYKSRASNAQHLIFLGGLTALLYLRFLCGYEYVTTLAIMVIATSLYVLTLEKTNIKELLKRVVWIGAAPVLAFVLAFSTHVLSLNQQTGSTVKSIEIIKNRAQERTVNAEYYTKYAYQSLEDVANDFYRISNEFVKYDKLKDNGSIPMAVIVAYAAHMLLPVVHIPILSGVFASYSQSFLAFIFALFLLYKFRNKWVSKKQEQKVRSLYIATAVGTAGYFSWLVFAYSHSLVHAFINGILMYLPAALFGFIIIGLYIEFLINKYIHRK